jgi:acid phosphatase family membrane protein YuiD
MWHIYLFSPLIAWGISGSIKFLINSIKIKKLAFEQIGYGGFPSTHTAIVTSGFSTYVLIEGINSSFVIAISLVLIVMLDALDLRKKIGEHAVYLNELKKMNQNLRGVRNLREKMGHNIMELIGGCGAGILSSILSIKLSQII